MALFGVKPSQVASRLRGLREARGWTQSELADRASLGEKYYQNLEAGRRRNPSLETLNKLAEALEVPVLALLYAPEEIGRWLPQGQHPDTG